jgi:hypothetical protein
MVIPATVRLNLSDGDWIDVKRELSFGDRNRMKASLVSEIRADGRITPDLQMVELAQVLAYLVEWSLVDPRGKQIPIDTEAKKRAALEGQDEATVREIIDAITAHAEQMEATKNAQGGESPSSSTSPSAA